MATTELTKTPGRPGPTPSVSYSLDCRSIRVPGVFASSITARFSVATGEPHAPDWFDPNAIKITGLTSNGYRIALIGVHPYISRQHRPRQLIGRFASDFVQNFYNEVD
jgi:hypothetical protein